MKLDQCYFGDNRDVMRDLIARGAAGKVQTIVTSPPYWGLRDYGVPPTYFPAVTFAPVAGLPPITVPEWTGCLGLEPDPWMFVGHMVEVFRLARELLADSGTLWLNLGDTYATGAGKVGSRPGGGQQGDRWAMRGEKLGDRSSAGGIGPMTQPNRLPIDGLKQKDLCGIPWRVAFALQADGWYLRQDVIWSKLNPMPESTRDRCTKAHEYVFILGKSGSTLLWRHRDGRWVGERPSPDYRWKHRKTGAEVSVDPCDPENFSRINLWEGFDYYFEADAIAEPLSVSSVSRLSQDVDSQLGSDRVPGKTNGTMKAVGGINGTRNKRSVWPIGSEPYSEAHFATFPQALVEPCILAGSRPGDTVLDIFFGSGTTGQVAQRLGRRWVGIELNEKNEPLQRDRTRQMGLELVA